MALNGSLETLGLQDVLSLLAGTNKTGELRINADRLSGRLWFSDGALIGSDVGRSQGFVDALFELLRLTSGTFSFDADRKAPTPQTPTPIALVLSEAEDRLAEWHEIEKIVPALTCRVSLAAELAQPEVIVSGDQWKLIVSFGPGGTVNDLVEHYGYTEFDAHRAVRDLVVAGFVTVTTDAETAAEVAEEEVVEAPSMNSTDDALHSRLVEFADELETHDARSEDADAAVVEANDESDEADSEVSDIESQVEEEDEIVEHATTHIPGRKSVVASEEDAAAARVSRVTEDAPDLEDVMERMTSGAADDEETGPTPVPVVGPDGELLSDEEPINRGLLLKFLSSVKT